MHETSAGSPFLAGWRQGWTPDPERSVSEWADERRVLSRQESPEPGPWRTDRVPYCREPMDCLSAGSPIRRVVLVWGTQLGKTEIILNWSGYVIDQTPAPMLMIQPTLNMAKRVSKQRLAAMIRSTPALAGRVREARSRDSGNTTFEKEFDGGIYIITGANSASALASMPIMHLAADEIDRYPADVDREGSPLALAEERTSNFPNGKILITSTPTVKGFSAIETEFLRTDQRRYFVPCPFCNHMDYIQWRLGGRSGEDGRHHHISFDAGDPASVHMVCSACGKPVGEYWKTRMLAAGQWRPTAPGEKTVRGYHLPSMYSPIGWKSWESLVRKAQKAGKDPARVKTFVNTTLAETYKLDERSTSATALELRRKAYASEVPAGVLAITAAVDVQKDRFEVKVKGYGAGEESWLLAYSQVHGDPSSASTQRELDAMLGSKFQREDGSEAAIDVIAVDANYKSEDVYQYVASRRRWRIYAVRGGSIQGLPLVGRFTDKNAYRVRLYTLCTDTGKQIVDGRLAILEPGPGYMHFPDWADREYFEQLIAETCVTKYQRGGGVVRQWVKTRDRNEARDLEVYCLAALYIFGHRALVQKGIRTRGPASRQEPAHDAFAEPVSEHAPDPGKPRPPVKRNSGGWATGWKRGGGKGWGRF